jgi:hypothetical protein
MEQPNERTPMTTQEIARAYRLGQEDAALGDLPELASPENVSGAALDAYWRGVRDYRALTALGY